ncbi:MAG TPA: formate dehydrogenase subunit gamma [Candidatus Binataceae bacterium]|nr:formate dehydrogenase subunit gamma [Candidatus Binataceae bacterium]
MAMDKLSQEQHARVVSIARALKQREGALLPILHRVQAELGHIPPAAVAPIAEELNLSRAEVHGVISFYHDFRTTPAGRVVIQLCRAESCQAVGAQALADRVRKRLGIDFGQTGADGAATLLPVYCLGNCACSPAITIDGQLFGRLTPERLDELLDAHGLRAQAR